MSQSANPTEEADSIMTTYDRKEALIRRAQRKDTCAQHYRRKGRMDMAMDYHKQAYEARKVARQL